MRRNLVAVLGLVLVVAGCGDDDALTTTTTHPAETTTTTLPTETSTTLEEPSGTTPGRFIVDPVELFPDPLPGSGGAHGSGCTVEGEALPGGIWFGFALEVAGGAVIFELACLFVGDAAAVAATEDGEEVFDFYIRKVGRTFSVAIDHDVVVYAVKAGAYGISTVQIDSVEWPLSGEEGVLDCPGEFCAVWLYVNDGVVTGIVEEYFP